MMWDWQAITNIGSMIGTCAKVVTATAFIPLHSLLSVDPIIKKWQEEALRSTNIVLALDKLYCEQQHLSIYMMQAY